MRSHCIICSRILNTTKTLNIQQYFRKFLLKVKGPSYIRTNFVLWGHLKGNHFHCPLQWGYRQQCTPATFIVWKVPQPLLISAWTLSDYINFESMSQLIDLSWTVVYNSAQLNSGYHFSNWPSGAIGMQNCISDEKLRKILKRPFKCAA